jgi:hypothetical protein
MAILIVAVGTKGGTDHEFIGNAYKYVSLLRRASEDLKGIMN